MNDEQKIRISFRKKSFEGETWRQVKKEVQYGPFGFAYTNKWKDANNKGPIEGQHSSTTMVEQAAGSGEQ